MKEKNKAGRVSKKTIATVLIAMIGTVGIGMCMSIAWSYAAPEIAKELWIYFVSFNLSNLLTILSSNDFPSFPDKNFSYRFFNFPTFTKATITRISAKSNAAARPITTYSMPTLLKKICHLMFLLN